MAWVSIDDQFHDHPKAEQVGPLGRDLYVAGLEYANRNLTDGFIPKATAGRLVSFYEIPGINVTVNPYDVVQLLLDAGLWDSTDGGFQIHDYLEYQPSSEEVTKRRELKRERQQRWREKQEQSESSTHKVDDASVDAPRDDLQDDLQDGQTQDPRPKTQVIPKNPKPKARNIAATSAAREPDPLFNAIAEAWMGEPYRPDLLNEKQAPLVGAATAALRKVGARPEDVPAEWRRLNARYDNPTPAALAKHWGTNGSRRATEASGNAPPSSHIPEWGPDHPSWDETLNAPDWNQRYAEN